MVPRTIASTYVQLVREYLQRAGLQAEDWVQGEPLQLLNQTPAANRGERASYALFTDLLAQLDQIAQHQLRSRNSLIHWMLSEQIKSCTGRNPAQPGKRKPAG